MTTPSVPKESAAQRIAAIIALPALITFFVRLPALDLISIVSASIGAVAFMAMAALWMRDDMRKSGPPGWASGTGRLLYEYRYSTGIVAIAAAVSALVANGFEVSRALPGMIVIPIIFVMFHLCVLSLVRHLRALGAKRAAIVTSIWIICLAAFGFLNLGWIGIFVAVILTTLVTSRGKESS